jgi:hypothetical protein
LKITRRKYVFVDSKGGQVEVVSEDSEPSQGKLSLMPDSHTIDLTITAISRDNLTAEEPPKVRKKGKHLLMSLISGGADYTIKQQNDDQ